LTATGGVPPYTWSVTSGALPSGLSLSTGGVISGIPIAVGTFSFSAQVEDSTLLTASQPFSITINQAGLAQPTGVFSQIVTGAGWTTTIWLVNRTTAPVQVGLTFHSDNGGTLTLPFTVTQPAGPQLVAGNTLNEVIQPNTTLVIATLPQVLNVEGWVDVVGGGAISGFAFYSNGTTEAEVPLQSAIATSFTLPFDNSNGNGTAVAIVNLAAQQAAFSATIWDKNGNQIATLPVSLTLADTSGNGHDSFLLATKIPVTAGIRGIIQFTGNAANSVAPAGQITGLGLRVDSNNEFTSMQTIVP
jgi:hypothetical protein